MDDELRERLALWKARPEIPPDFQRGVWSRIAARESSSSDNSWLSFLSLGWITLPRLAALALILGGFIGTGAGLLESTQANTRSWKTLEAKYVESIDPYEHLGTY